MGKVNNFMSNKDMQKYIDEIDNHKYTCKCGHKVFIPYDKEKALCSWCNRYVFKDKKDEFLFRLKEKIK